MTEAQKEAKARYREKNGGMYIQFYPADADIRNRLEERSAAGEPKTTYIKRLIREDIAKERE